jgi:hypothetical protein
MSVIDAININHGNNHENKHFSEQIGSKIFFVSEEINDTFHGKGSRSLSRMYSGRYKYDRFIELKGSFKLWKDKIVKKLLICIFLILVVMRSNSKQMNVAPLWAFD